MIGRSPAVLALTGLLAGGLLAGCGGTNNAVVKKVAAPSPVPSSAAPSPSASPVPPSPEPTNWLTGLAVRRSSVVVIKVDNAATARRYQRGLGQAAIVYQELVESGQTRFAAVFDNGYTGEVGPIRSVRETDIELLAQYGRVAVGFSGGNTGVKATFHKAVRAGKLLDASYDVVPGTYRLAERRIDARNFFASPAALSAVRTGAVPRDIGLVFGPLALTAGTPAASARMAFSDMMHVGVRYNAGTGTWTILQDGVPMRGVAPANIIVQSVQIRHSRYVDVMGAPTPYTVTTGRGNALILRDGRALRATWKRTSAKAGTHYLDDKGRDLPLKPGPTWVLLLPKTRSASLA